MLGPSMSASTSATRAPGTHAIGVDLTEPPLAELPDGEYTLVVEAAREVGGRELLKIPFAWPIASLQTLKAEGKNELGDVVLELKP